MGIRSWIPLRAFCRGRRGERWIVVGSPRRFLTPPDHDVIRESRINDCSGIRSDSRFNRLPFVASHRGRLRLPNTTYVHTYVRSCRLLYYYSLLHTVQYQVPVRTMVTIRSVPPPARRSPNSCADHGGSLRIFRLRTTCCI